VVMKEIIYGIFSRRVAETQSSLDALDLVQDFVLNQMESDTARGSIRSIKEISPYCLPDGGSHRCPVVPLCYDRFCQTLGNIASVRFLR
jgi:hypothetical protein